MRFHPCAVNAFGLSGQQGFGRADKQASLVVVHKDQDGGRSLDDASHLDLGITAAGTGLAGLVVSVSGVARLRIVLGLEIECFAGSVVAQPENGNTKSGTLAKFKGFFLENQ